MHVTVEAREALSGMLARKTTNGECLRLTTFHGNYRFTLDEPIEQDIAFRHEERVVLTVSETISRDLWGITIDCAGENGHRKLVFRKSRPGEPMDTIKEREDAVPPEWKAKEHERLLAEIAEIGRQMTSLRGASKSSLREQLQSLEAAKQARWDDIRSLWAGDGQSHRRGMQGLSAKTAD